MMKRVTFLNLILASLCIFLVSCSAYVTKIDVSDKIVLPTEDNWESIKFNAQENQGISGRWWRVFEDSILDSIMIVFLDNNFDLKMAFSSLQSSKAMKKINGSDIFPTANVSLLDANSLGFGNSVPPGTYGLNLSSSWEADVWGKNISKRFSASKEHRSSENEYEYLKLSIISQAVKMYFNLVESKEQENLANSSVDALQDIYNIVEDRYNQGVRSSLDYRLALSNLLISKSTLQQRKMIHSNFTRQLETLIGVYPAGKLSSSDEISSNLIEIPANLPSTIIENRPDIVSAYNRMESARYTLDASNKALLPMLMFTDFSGAMSSSLKELIDSEFSIWNLGTRLTLPLFQSGKIRANKELSKAMYGQAEIQYLHTILKAFSEIENKLSSSINLENQLDALKEAYIQSEEAYNLAKDRYENGLSDLITVLDSQKRMFDTKGQMISIRRALIENRIDLLICLGGRVSEDS